MQIVSPWCPNRCNHRVGTSHQKCSQW